MRVELDEVAFAYGGGEDVVAGVSFAMADGGITVVIGPSGSGKSTLVALVAGLLEPAAGRILFAGRDIARVPPERRGVGVVFQSYALFPHLSVHDNISFGLTTGAFGLTTEVSGLTTRRLRPPRQEREARVRELADLLGLGPLLGRRPGELSGGERQRVALARALAPRPALLLLDEPLAALDASLRRQLRAELAALLSRLGTTVLYVTHDQEEAMMLADHLVVLDRGRVVEAGAPLALYRRPSHPFVASFLGEANLLAVSTPPGGRGSAPVLCLAEEAGAGSGAAAPASGGWLLIRPEDLVVVADDTGTPAVVLEVRGLGAFDRVVLRLADGTELDAHLPAGTAPAPGATLRIAARRIHLLPRLG
ncbi:MAG TPA: ABC transporter ATP-binding protein [Thermoanaerobaculia bacterium]